MNLQSLKRTSNFLLLLVMLLLCPDSILAQQNKPKPTSQAQANLQIKGHNNVRKLAKLQDQQATSSESKPHVGDDAQLRRLYELELLRDPATGMIPEEIRKKELAFAQRLNKDAGAGRKSTARVVESWKNRGPYNVGGRTRALALDLDNENIILAGGVSGGMWRSEDGGLTWVKTTGTSEIQSVTAIAQDPRPGQHHVWYYSTGERLGNSASGGGSFFGGNGIYKSTDGGRSWNILPSTADNAPQFHSPFDLTFNIVVHPTTGDVYVATWWGIHRSVNGGATFTEVLAGGVDNWTDIMITPGGIVYGVVDSGGTPNKGIFRSTDGTTWSNITPVGYPAAVFKNWGRAILAYTPLNENIIHVYGEYVFTANNRDNSGSFLWRYNHDEASPVWTNLSANLPAFGGRVGNLNTQGGYNLVLKVHPADPNVIFLGGTNLYRSTNGFTATTGTAWIGGYSPINNVSIYPNQHPDQHALLFYPSNPQKALSANDGGIHYTENIVATNAGTLPVTWTSLNNGYLTTQPYAVSFDPASTSDHLLAGFQDNGTWFTNSSSQTATWKEDFGGDGSYNMIADNGLTRYVSSQSGNIYRFNFAQAGAIDYTSFTRITPAGAFAFGFINPFVLDPNNDNIMYLPEGNRIWRNDNLDAIPVFSNAPATVNWNNLANTQVPSLNSITALAVSKMPANRLYFGTNRGLVYRIDNANIGDQPKVDISTNKGFPLNAYVSCITVDPTDANRVFVVFSNYNITSIFYSDNGGTTWTNIGGNLEENADGTGSGPSVRWLAIEGNSDRYYVGTSTGLYTTTTLNGISTTWNQEDTNGIGNVVVPMVRTRADGFVAVASHGNGIYSAKFDVTPLPEPTLKLANPVDDLIAYKNNSDIIIDISNVFEDTDGDAISLSLLNTNSAVVTAMLKDKFLVLSLVSNAIGKTTIGIIATSKGESISEAFTVTIKDIENVLYAQNTALSNMRPSQLFTDFGNILTQTADDFEVPAGQTWTIEKLFIPGSALGTPVLNQIIVDIHSDNENVPGNLVYSSGAIAPASGTIAADLELVLPAPVNFTGGKYWLTVYARLAFAGSNQWFWRTTLTVNGNESHFKDSGNLFGTDAFDWTPGSVAFGGLPSDQLFTIIGKGQNFPSPKAPSALDAFYHSPTRFTLTWTDSANNELGFLIERSTDGNVFTKRATVGTNQTTYDDTDFFDPALTYYYRVAAIGIGDTSAYSNIDSIAIPAAAPIAKPATFVFPTFFIANWEASPYAKHYVLDVSSDDFATYLTGFKGKVVNGTSHLVVGTSFTKSYNYQVRAVNAGGESENSNVMPVIATKDLKLSAMCSDNPRTTRRWRITNPNPFDIEVEWLVYLTNQKGKVIAPPGESYFTTNTVWGLNTTMITWRDDKYLPHIAVKISTTAECRATNYNVAYGRSDAPEDALETETPFIIDAWPNPVEDKFKIIISSPLEDEVELNIYGIKGERIHSSKVQSNVIVEVDATNYIPGMYLITGKQLFYHKTLQVEKK
jgi:hypothetical protein